MPEDTKASSQGEALLLRDPNLHVIFGVTLMAVLGVSSITPAFPQIADELNLSPGAVGMLVAIFTLPGATLTPVIGVLGDRIGRKRVLIPSLFLFAIAGTACGFARDFEMLLWLRLLQGMGAAALGALNITIVGDLYSGWKRATVMGYNASVLSVGTALYPAVGGALALIGWFYPFFLPVLALPVALLVLWRLKNPEPSMDEKLSTYLRNTLISVRNPRALGLFLASLVIFVVLYGAYLTYLPFLLRLTFDASPLLIGLVFSATSLATAVTSWRLGRLARRFSERNLVRLGFAFYAVAISQHLVDADGAGTRRVPCSLHVGERDDAALGSDAGAGGRRADAAGRGLCRYLLRQRDTVGGDVGSRHSCGEKKLTTRRVFGARDIRCDPGRGQALLSNRRCG
jgi:MFS family permease